MEGGHESPQRVAAVDGHEAAPEAVVGSVKGDGEPHAGGLLGKTPDGRNDPHRRDGETADAHGPQLGVVEDRDGLEKGIGVEKRLPHPHEDHVGDILPELGLHGQKLTDNLARLQIPYKSPLAGGAEGAGQRATHLRGEAGRPPVVVDEKHRFHRFAVLQAPEELFRSVPLGGNIPGQIGRTKVQLRDQSLPQVKGEVGHLRNIEDALAIDPGPYLVGAEARFLVTLLKEGAQLFITEIESLDDILHMETPPSARFLPAPTAYYPMPGRC